MPLPPRRQAEKFRHHEQARTGLGDQTRDTKTDEVDLVRRLVALARTEHRTPAVARAFGEGSITAFQALSLAHVADRTSAEPASAEGTSAPGCVECTRRVTLRRLEDDAAVEAATSGEPAAIAFRAPPAVAALFFEVSARADSLEALLAHAIAAWIQAGELFDDYADFEPDGFRCTVPGCTARRNLHSHHIRFRSACGPNLPWNRTTLCATHHQRAVHLGTLRIHGRAPGALLYELGEEPTERFRSGDLRVATAHPRRYAPRDAHPVRRRG